MSREKQIDIISKIIARKAADYRNPNVVFMTTAKKSATAIYHEFLDMQRGREGEWISVEDRLPETSIADEVIICTADGEVGAARFKRRLGKGQFDWISNEGSDFYDGDNVARVTHWMPLPEAPKMKGGAE